MRDGALPFLLHALFRTSEARRATRPSWRSELTPPPLSPLLSSRAAEAETHEGKRKTESLWPIMRITHTRSRCVSLAVLSSRRPCLAPASRGV